MTTERIDIQVREDGSRVVRRNLDDLSVSARSASGSVNNLGVATNFAAGLFKGFAVSLAGIGLSGLAGDILATNRQMESLRAQLVGVTGSINSGRDAFDFVQKFAADTPFEVEGLTKSFISLKNFGIEPTKQVMEALTNQAAKLGGSQETLNAITLQLGQGYAKGKLQLEDLIVLSERGVPVFDLLAKVTGLQGEALQKLISNGGITKDVIDKLIIKMGELASGSNARAMDTLNGAISNLSDSWHKFTDMLLNDKAEAAIKRILGSITNSLDAASAALKGGTFADFLQFASRGTPSIQKLLPTPKTGGASGSFGPSAFGVTGDFGEPLKQAPLVQKSVVTQKRESSTRTPRLADTAGADYIKQLEREVALQNDSSRAAKVKYDLQVGAYGKITPLQKQTILDLNSELDANDKQSAQWKVLIEDANAYYDLRKEIVDLAKTDLTSDTFGAGIAKVQDALGSGLINQAQAKEQFDILGKSFNESFVATAKKGTDELSQYSVQAARSIQSSFADFLFNPAEKGFKGLLDSAIDTFKRIAAESASAFILGKAQKGLDSVGGLSGIFDGVSGLFGGGGGSKSLQGISPLVSSIGKGKGFGDTVSGALGLLSSFFHDGGVAGHGGSQKVVDASVFLGAQRYHDGGFPGLRSDEVPAILQKGEQVLSKGEAKAATQRAVNININMNGIQNSGDIRMSTAQLAQRAGSAVAVALSRNS